MMALLSPAPTSLPQDSTSDLSTNMSLFDLTLLQPVAIFLLTHMTKSLLLIVLPVTPLQDGNIHCDAENELGKSKVTGLS